MAAAAAGSLAMGMRPGGGAGRAASVLTRLCSPAPAPAPVSVSDMLATRSPRARDPRPATQPRYCEFINANINIDFFIHIAG